MIIYKFEIRSPTMTILRSPRAQLFFFQEKKKKKKIFFITIVHILLSYEIFGL
jgi:hypothetical protein